MRASFPSLLGVAASCFVALVVACSGTSSNASGTPYVDGGVSSGPDHADASTKTQVAATPQGACAALARATCAKQKSCNAFLFSARWGDEATCQARLELGCADKLTEPGVTWKADALAACSEALPTAACDDLALRVLPVACVPSPGTLAISEACAHDEQCTTGHCKKGSFGQCGACKEAQKEGGACSQGEDCAAGLVCSRNVCRAPAKQGQSCAGTPCASGLSCLNGRCDKGAPVGTACADSATSPDPCDQAAGIFCNPIDMACEAAKVIANGESCTGLLALCGGAGRCNGAGDCQAPPQEGDSCTVSGSGAGCFAPSVCDNGKCVVPSAAACSK